MILYIILLLGLFLLASSSPCLLMVEDELNELKKTLPDCSRHFIYNEKECEEQNARSVAEKRSEYRFYCKIFELSEFSKVKN